MNGNKVALLMTGSLLVVIGQIIALMDCQLTGSYLSDLHNSVALESSCAKAIGQSLVKATTGIPPTAVGPDTDKFRPEKVLADPIFRREAAYFAAEVEASFKNMKQFETDQVPLNEVTQTCGSSLLKLEQEFWRYFSRRSVQAQENVQLLKWVQIGTTILGLILIAIAIVSQARFINGNSSSQNLKPPSDTDRDSKATNQQSENENLAILTDNVQRAAKGLPLNAPLNCADQWGEIDEALHSLCQTVQVQEEFRRNMLATVAHDIRSPMASIALFLETVRDDIFGPITSAGKARADDSIQILNRLTALTDDLLKVERESTQLGTRVNQDLEVLVNEAMMALNGVATARNVKLQFASQHDGAAFVTIDDARILQVIMNLVTNAIKFSPVGSTVAISVDKADSQFYKVSVQDQGSGVSAAMADKLFVKFENDGRTLSYKGYGLGLSIAKSIVEQHGGQIGFENLSKGSSFWFTLPRDK